MKRRAPSPELSDSENVDPSIFDAIGKRKRTAFDDDVSLSKPSRYGVYVIPAASKPSVQPVANTPRLNTIHKPATAPMSAPAAAGRSPTRGKKMGLLKPSKRYAPSFGKSPSLSITAALKGTLANKRAKKARTIQESKPSSWSFDIFEEAEEVQDYRMNEWTMTQSANILDISDDEAKAQEKRDKGKENIDPTGLSVPVTRSMSANTKPAVLKITRKNTMPDEPRTPLGSLNASDFYGEGLDATSVVLVHDDVETQELEQEVVTPASAPEYYSTSAPVHNKSDFTFSSQTPLSEKSRDPIDTTDIGALIADSIPIWTDSAPVSDKSQTTLDPTVSFSISSTDIDIWESESAKDENEQELDENKFDESQCFALQDL